MRYELQPLYDSRKSFYRKAFVEIDNNKMYLYSYNTQVAYIDENGIPHLLYNYNYSATTLRHVKEFILQAGYEIAPANKLCKMYGNLHIAENYEKAKQYKQGIKKE